VGIASLTEGITSLVGVVFYLLWGKSLPWELALPLLAGASLSAPAAAFLVSKLPEGKLTPVIGGITTVLGSYTLARLLI
jgi:uncharacterized membrane protein YfcA